MAVRPVRYKERVFRVAYEAIRPEKEKTLVILHGWGSNKALMRRAFGEAFDDYALLYVDLPGFGASENSDVLSTRDYAEIVARLLQALGRKADAAAGHSFGGKVATLLRPDRLILLSSAGIVLPKPLGVRVKIALFKALKPFGGGRLRRFFASKDASDMPPNMYETFKKVVDEDFSEIFAAYDKPALLCWGEADTATPPIAGRRIAALMPRAKFRLFEGDHYFFLSRPDPVIREMEAFLHETV
ncbi:MAG: alpha/beta hydrolase [Epsilonproteobacteria bacterium]|nr:alpha/beta hydrolase [Campylobacterota bacterium]